MAILCQSSQIMLTECPPAAAPNTVPPPGLSTPTSLGRAVQGPEASAGKRRRRCRDRLAHQRVGAALAKCDITALAVRPLTAMRTGAGAVVIDRDAVLAEDLSPVDALVHPWLQPMLGNPFFSVRELPTRCNWTSWFDNTQKRLDVVRDVHAQKPPPPLPPSPLPSMRRARFSDHAHHSRVRPQCG